MKRTKALRLVLLGGGVATMLASCGDDTASREACERAKREQRADAMEICRRSTSNSSRSSSGWWYGRSGSSSAFTSATARSSASSRGGFGSSAHSFSGG